ncbi:MAG: hypothetical protein HXX08_03625 [Chloroflexi bacterium]|uniref:YggT family protein n=1 Tax=Candidatus Chlorohelix allophototropha TaxID=3003348 RepID=A0A8T7LVN9_9CHLR|nr:hypothetical protein [Chloroflexota bacterium]WJW66828.1 hypothetical protein OZ401_000073 [Chloroflexota bacterium L227-S17]
MPVKQTSIIGILYVLLSLSGSLLLVRFIFKLFAVSQNIIYNLSEPLVAPFKAILKPSDLVVGATFESYTLLTFFILLVVGGIIAGIVSYISHKNSDYSVEV